MARGARSRRRRGGGVSGAAASGIRCGPRGTRASPGDWSSSFDEPPDEELFQFLPRNVSFAFAEQFRAQQRERGTADAQYEADIARAIFLAVADYFANGKLHTEGAQGGVFLNLAGGEERYFAVPKPEVAAFGGGIDGQVEDPAQDAFLNVRLDVVRLFAARGHHGVQL